MQSGVVAGVPVDAIRSEVKSVIDAIRVSPASRSSRPRITIAGSTLEVKTTTTNEGDRLAEGGRHGGKKLFIGLKRHGHTPSP